MPLDAAADTNSSPHAQSIKHPSSPIPTDQRIGVAVVFEVGFTCGFEFGDDALGKITLEASHNDRKLLTGFAVLQKEV
jgi:hypothetical protein